MDEASWSVRVTAGRAQGSTVHVRTHAFSVGAPLSFDREYAAVTALEHLLGAVGADLVGCIAVVARRRRVEIADVEVVVTAELHNPMVYLRVVGEEGDAGIRAITARVYVSSLDDEDRVRALWDEVVTISPIANTLGKAVALDLECQIVL